MKKLTYSKILSISLASGLILAININVHAETNLDFNNNGIIDTTDLGILATNYNLKSGDSKWDSKYDLNSDNLVDVFDLVKVSKVIETTVLSDNTDITSKFTDANFKNEIYTKIGKASPNPILYSDVNKITSLNIGFRYIISNLSGIEYFTSLTSLSCSSSGLRSLDLSKNTELTSLTCRGGSLTSLDITKNTKLNYLDCYHNQLTTLDVSKNTLLTYLECDENQITTLDVSKNIALTVLNCSSNKLTTLDVSNNVALTRLYCHTNKLTNLDVSNNTKLTYLPCSYNQLTTLDVSNNPLLTGLFCHNNNITSLDLSKVTALTDFSCTSNNLTTLDVSKNIELIDLRCDFNHLKILDISKNTLLKYFYCGDNQLTTLDVSKHPELTWLYCESNQLTTLDLSNNPKLYNFYCYSNQLTSLDITNNPKLYDFRCYSNQLTTLYVIRDIRNNWNLGTQYTDPTHTTAINNLVVILSDNANITSYFGDANFKAEVYKLIGKTSSEPILYSDVNKITYLDVSNKDIDSLRGIEYFKSLITLDCSYNHLFTLDISKNTVLSTLNCSYNYIEQLYSIKNTWANSSYKTQYSSTLVTETVDTLAITIKN